MTEEKYKKVYPQMRITGNSICVYVPDSKTKVYCKLDRFDTWFNKVKGSENTYSQPIYLAKVEM